MNQLPLIRFLLLINCFSNLPCLDAVRCFRKNLYSENNETCDGDFCIASRGGSVLNLGITQTCVTGVKMPSYPCSLDFADSMQCYCNTDFCNTSSLFRSNITVLPVIECKEVYNKEYRASACNKCIWSVDYIKYDGSLNPTNTKETVKCGESGESSRFNLDLTIQIYDRIGLNFFTNACYNVTMHPEQYTLYCKCSTPNCNNPEGSFPYPLSPPTISCYTSGYDADINNAKYDTPQDGYFHNYRRLRSNDSYNDEGIQCRGHFCFIVTDKHDDDSILHYKGCISANEQGEDKIQLGYSFVNDVPYYICNTDFCNSDIATTLEEAANATTIRDNSPYRMNLIYVYFSFFVIDIFVRL